MATSALPQKPSTASVTRVNNTLYCSNLPDKLQKEDLKQALYMLCSTYGSILDIVALKTPRMRGQTHVLFRDTQASMQAMRALQGFEFFGKEMKVAYATSKSDTLAKLDGTYKQPETASNKLLGTTAQQSVFAGPPGTSTSVAQVPNKPPPGLAPPPASGASQAASPSDAATPASQGVKRARDDSDEEDEAPMDVDDDAMEESDEE